jgi:cell division protein FtsN
MKFKDINFLVFLIFSACLIGCGSGEYDLEQTQVEYVEKTLKYDTIQTTVRDTVEKIEDVIKNNKSESFTFIVQIGAFRIIENYQRFFESAKTNLGSEVYSVLINDIYRIRIGNYNNKADALKMLEYVKSLGYYDAFILTIINK